MTPEAHLDKLTGWLGPIVPLLGLQSSPRARAIAESVLAKIEAWQAANPITDESFNAALDHAATVKIEAAKKKQEAQAAAAAELEAAGITAITDGNVEMLKDGAEHVVLVWAPGCAPCASYKPAICAAAKLLPEIRWHHFQMTAAPSRFRREYLALGKAVPVPMTVRIHGGEVTRAEGVMDTAALGKFLGF
jgi:thiol-disulfide isomerase/thioredoxin